MKETQTQEKPPPAHPLKTQSLWTHLFCVTLGCTGQQAGLLALAHAIFNYLSLKQLQAPSDKPSAEHLSLL